MKEVIKVSIAGLAFDLDVGAYEELNAYLDRLDKMYEGNTDGVEIIADIEARIVELFLSQQSMETVVEKPLVRSVIEQLGLPDEAETQTGGDGAKYAPPTQPAERFPKRLYRNPEGAKIGGVCSGLGAYLNVDPVWLRIGIFVPVLLAIIVSQIDPLDFMSGFMGSLFGTFVLLYLILWIALPLAKTPRQLLEMRGERVTAAAIDNMANDFSREEVYRSASGSDRAMSAVGRILLFCIKAFVLVVGVCSAVAAVGVIVGMFSLPAIIDGIGIPEHAFGDLGWVTSRGFITLCMSLALIPMVMLAYGLICLVFSKRINRAVMWILAIAWIGIFIFVASTAVRNVIPASDGFRIEYRKENAHGGWRREIRTEVPVRIAAVQLHNFEIP